MLESILPVAALKTWLTKKATETAGNFVWHRIYSFFKPHRLKVEIDSALKSNQDIANVIQPAPVLEQTYLSQENMEAMLRTALTSDIDSLSELLIREQIVQLPPLPTNRPLNYDIVWNCIATVLLEAVGAAIQNDDALWRQFVFDSLQLNVALHRDAKLDNQGVLSLLQNVDAKIDGINESLVETSQSQVITDRATARIINRFTEENEALEQQLREQLDEKTEGLWDGIVAEIRLHNFRAVIEKSKELTGWLDERGNRISPAVRGRAFLLLAQSALVESSEWIGSHDGITRATELFEKARTEFGDNPSHENLLRLKSFHAKLLSVDGRDGEAMELLGTSTDAQTISTKLLILIDQRDFSVAKELILNLPFDEKWCDLAALVFAGAGDDARGFDATAWAINRELTWLEYRCRVAVARGSLSRLVEEHSGSAFTILSITKTAAATVERVLAHLTPLAEHCRIQSKVTNGVEADGVAFAHSLCRLLGRYDDARAYIALLRDWEPVHLEYASAVIRGDVDVDAEIANRMRADYPRYFNALEMALVIDLHAGRSQREILSAIEGLQTLSEEQEQRVRLAQIAFQVITIGDSELFDAGRELILRLLEAEHYLLKLLDVERHIKADELEVAWGLLEDMECPDSFVIDQFRVKVLIGQGKDIEAAQLLASVGQKMSDPRMLKHAARLASNSKPRRLDLAIESLEKAFVLTPDDVSVNRLLAMAYMDLNGYATAAECFRRLGKLEPDEPANRLNEALCLSLANRPDEALSIYDEFCGLTDAPLQVHLARAQLLCRRGKPGQAFENLHKIHDAHWDDPDFVACYLNIAHAADQDRRAHEAFQQLWHLQQIGKAPPEVLQEKNLDDLAEIGKSQREQREFLLDQSIGGRLPWLFFENLLGNVPYWGWRIRTQSLSWLAEDARNRASYCIYSTNSYGVFPVGGNKELRRIECSAPGQTVVADLSALITLHRLNLLPEALAYFENIKIPPSYLAAIVRQSGRLRPHQLSQVTSLRAIKAAVDNKQLQVIANSKVEHEIIVDEYPEDGEHPKYGIRDVLDALESGGRISSAQKSETFAVANKPPHGVTSGRTLRLEDRIVVSLLTLKTLANERMLNTLCESFDVVSIAEDDVDELTIELRGIETAEETQRWHDDLWAQIERDSRIDASTLVLHSHIVSRDQTTESDDSAEEGVLTEDDAGIHAALLAQQENLPLLVDDRVSQNILTQFNSRNTSPAFGTDCLILMLQEAGIIDDKRAATAFLQLIEWRYRFLIVPASVIRTIAIEFSTHQLRSVARYVHDCMRDPGLFNSVEHTTPPSSIAIQFYKDWVEAIVQFASELWLDTSISDERVALLTKWSIEEFLPTVPAVTADKTSRIGNLSSFLVLNQAMLSLVSSPDYSRANQALRMMASSLGLDDKQLIREAANVIDSYDLGEPKSAKDDARPYKVRMLRHAIEHQPEKMDFRTAMIALKNELFKSGLENPLPEDWSQIVLDSSHSRRWSDSHGKYLVFTDGDRARRLIGLTTLFLTPDSSIRRAVLNEIDRSIAFYRSINGLFISPFVEQRLNQLRGPIMSDDESESLAACIEISDLIEDDYFYQLSGVAQSRKFVFGTGLRESLAKVLSPSENAIQFLRDLPVSAPTQQLENYSQRRDRMIEDAQTLTELLQSYFRAFGHLPLTGQLSLAGVFRVWLDGNAIPDSAWNELLTWVNQTQSPFATYHASQLICHFPELVPSGRDSAFLTSIVQIVVGPKSDKRWKLRCELARHYCRHLETLNAGPDGERIAAFAWWLADTLAAQVDSPSSEMSRILDSVMEEQLNKSEEVWNIARPTATSSALRHATLFSPSIWAAAILCELSATGLTRLLDQQASAIELFEELLSHVQNNATFQAHGDRQVYSFQGSPKALADFILLSRPDSEQKALLQRLLAHTASGTPSDGSRVLGTTLEITDHFSSMLTAHELRMRAICGVDSGIELFELLSLSDWRKRFLVGGNAAVVEIIISAAIEFALHDLDHDWKTSLPHILALACDQTADVDRLKLLFSATIVASVSVNAVSGIERLLKGTNRRRYSEHVKEWRTRIERVTARAPSWIAAKLRALKCVMIIE